MTNPEITTTDLDPQTLAIQEAIGRPPVLELLAGSELGPIGHDTLAPEASPDLSIVVAREDVDAAYGPHEALVIVNEPSLPDNIPSLSDEHIKLTPVKAPKATLLSGLRERLESLDKSPKLTPRPATLSDIDALVDVDIKAFDSVYRDYELDPTELRKDLREKFIGRYEKVGGDWMPVLEKDGQVCGFMMCSPTSKQPEDFTNWEDFTDNGTLNNLYDPEGKNVYVVSLSMLPEGSATKGQNMLFANLVSKFIQEGYSQAFFESRLPGLRTWVRKQCREQKLDFATLSEEQKDDFANTYFGLTKLVDGKEVPHDRLLRMYASGGCKFVKLAPNAYRDKPSMNYGVVGVFDNPLPEKLQNNWIARNVAGRLLRLASKSRWLTGKIF